MDLSKKIPFPETPGKQEAHDAFKPTISGGPLHHMLLTAEAQQHSMTKMARSQEKLQTSHLMMKMNMSQTTDQKHCLFTFPWVFKTHRYFWCLWKSRLDRLSLWGTEKMTHMTTIEFVLRFSGRVSQWGLLWFPFPMLGMLTLKTDNFSV